MLARPAVYDNSLQRMVAQGDVICGGEVFFSLSTAGNGTITAAMLSNNLLTRTGPSAGFTDTTCSAAELIASLLYPEQDIVMSGTTYRFRYINTVAQAMTLAAGANVTLGSNVNVAASSVKEYLVTIVQGNRQQVYVASGVTGTPVLSGLSKEQLRKLSSGMAVSGTGIASNATVNSINVEAGTVTLSGNNTAGITNGTITFSPRVRIDSLGQLAL